MEIKASLGSQHESIIAFQDLHFTSVATVGPGAPLVSFMQPQVLHWIRRNSYVTSNQPYIHHQLLSGE